MIAHKKLIFYTGTGALAFALLFVIFAASWASTHERLSMTVFDVGQGDAILVRTPYHQNIVIDGGPDGSTSEKISERLPFFDRTLDLVVLTHPHADHVTGLIDLIDRYSVRRILINGVDHTTPEYRAFLEAIFRKRIPLEVVRSGDEFRFGDGCILDILAPLPDNSRALNETRSGDQDLNDSSIVATLHFNTSEFLLMGDAGARVEAELLARRLVHDIDVLKVGHHGSRWASGEALLAAAKPEIAVISSGRGNPYGHPHRESLERLKAANVQVYRTDERGDVELLSDGQHISIHSQR